MAAGRGFLAVALVILSGWRPLRLLALSLGLALTTAGANHLQGSAWAARLGSSEQLILILPFVVVLAASSLSSRVSRVPAGLAKWHDG